MDRILDQVHYLVAQADIYDRMLSRAFLHKDQRRMEIARTLRDAYDRAAELTFQLGVEKRESI